MTRKQDWTHDLALWDTDVTEQFLLSIDAYMPTR